MENHQKMNLYQIFTRLYHAQRGQNKPFGSIEENGCGKYNHFTDNVLQSIVGMGFSHVWFTGIIRHATCTDYSCFGIEPDNPLVVKGIAGSPYAIKDYFDVDPDLAEDIPNRMKEFEGLVERCHRNNLGVIIDFVPNHVCRQYRSLCKPLSVVDLGANDNPSIFFHPQNNFYYLGEQLHLPQMPRLPYQVNAAEYFENPAKATGNDVFHAYPNGIDWYETVKLNYGVNPHNGEKVFNPRPNTWDRMLEILLFWAGKQIDGFRVDMAEMVPVEFWTWVIAEVKKQYPKVLFVAEVYNPSLYSAFLEAGFDYLYDKEQFYNVVRDILKGQTSTHALTQVWQAQEGIGHRLLRFLENHDEQRLASDHFCGDARAAMPAVLVACTMHTGPLMVYFGQELGEPASETEGFSGNDGRTTIFDYWCIDSIARWLVGGETNLTENERLVRNFYLTCIALRNQFRDVLQAGFFDLMYVNNHQPWANKTYAYLRYNKGTVALVVVNFDRYEAKDISLVIPSLAFEMIGISAGYTLRMQNRLGEAYSIEISVADAVEKGISLTLKPSGALFFVGQ